MSDKVSYVTGHSRAWVRAEAWQSVLAAMVDGRVDGRGDWHEDPPGVGRRKRQGDSTGDSGAMPPKRGCRSHGAALFAGGDR